MYARDPRRFAEAAPVFPPHVQQWNVVLPVAVASPADEKLLLSNTPRTRRASGASSSRGESCTPPELTAELPRQAIPGAAAEQEAASLNLRAGRLRARATMAT